MLLKCFRKSKKIKIPRLESHETAMLKFIEVISKIK